MTTWTSAASILATSRTHSFVLSCIAGWPRSWTVRPGHCYRGTRHGDDGPRTHKRQPCTESQPSPGCPGHPGRRCRRGDRTRGEPRRRVDTRRPTGPDRDRAPDHASASAVRHATDELLAPGTYFVDEVDGTPTPRIFVTVGAGWSNFDRRRASARTGPLARRPDSPEDDGGFITFSRPDKVYLDACHLSDGFYPGPLTTVDGLVTALTEQQADGST